MKEESPWLTLAEAAAYCRRKVEPFRRLAVDHGKVKHYRPTGPRGRIYFRREDLDAFMSGKKPEEEEKRKEAGRPRQKSKVW